MLVVSNHSVPTVPPKLFCSIDFVKLYPIYRRIRQCFVFSDIRNMLFTKTAFYTMTVQINNMPVGYYVSIQIYTLNVNVHTPHVVSVLLIYLHMFRSHCAIFRWIVSSSETTALSCTSLSIPTEVSFLLVSDTKLIRKRKLSEDFLPRTYFVTVFAAGLLQPDLRN